jgi:anti-sigma factor RsiW
MTDAALGALDAERKRELLAHAAECQTCRASYWRGSELATLVDRGVESLVSGEPSPYFLTRLRPCIASDGAPSAALGWKAIGAVALLAAIVVAVIVSHGVRTAQPTDARVETAPNCASKSTTNEPQGAAPVPAQGSPKQRRCR